MNIYVRQCTRQLKNEKGEVIATQPGEHFASFENSGIPQDTSAVMIDGRWFVSADSVGITTEEMDGYWKASKQAFWLTPFPPKRSL